MNYFNYFTEIEDTFVRRRGKHLFLSPIDWALIEAWQDRGVPLHIVLRSIESVFDVFDQQPPGTRTIKSLFYCREEIESQYKEWVTAQTGKPGDVEATTDEISMERVAAHIDRAIDGFSKIPGPALAEDLARSIERLTELRDSLPCDLETIDGSLADIERLLERSLVTNWDPVHLKSLEKEVSGQLKQYKSEMDPSAYKSTFDLMLMKRLREEAGLPRLGLFYI